MSNITSQLRSEELRKLFEVLGGVVNLQLLGNDMALIEMGSLADAQVGADRDGSAGLVTRRAGSMAAAGSLTSSILGGRGRRGRAARDVQPRASSPSQAATVMMSGYVPAHRPAARLHPCGVDGCSPALLTQAALMMNGHVLGDKALSVQLLSAAQETMASNPLMALKLQQIQQMQVRAGGAGRAGGAWHDARRCYQP